MRAEVGCEGVRSKGTRKFSADFGGNRHWRCASSRGTSAVNQTCSSAMRRGAGYQRPCLHCIARRISPSVFTGVV